MKLWTVIINSSEHDEYYDTFVDVYAHPPSIDEILQSLHKVAGGDGVFSQEDVQPMLDGPALRKWHRPVLGSKWSSRFQLHLEEVERHI